MKRSSRARAALVFLLALPGAAAWAERADRDRVATVSADHSSLDDLHQVEVLTGHVVLVKGSMRLTGERMERREDELGYQHYLVTTVPGALATFHERRDPVKPGVEDTVDCYGERIEYDERTDQLWLNQRALVKHFENGELHDELSGVRIVYDARKATYEIDGRNSDGSGDRVHIRIAPHNAPPIEGKGGPGLRPASGLPEGAH